MPDFLIIGAGKSGTTSLNSYLSQHPEIYMSPVKEPNFFAYADVERSSLSSPETIKHYEELIKDIDTYLSLFRGAKVGQLKGEVSNTYMTRANSATLIQKYVPQAKIIAILRNPVDRLYSRYLHLARDNRLAEIPPFMDGLKDRNSAWWRREDLIPEGFYHKNLTPYFDLFPLANIKVILFDDFNRNQTVVLKDLFSFLGVDNNFKPDVGAKLNQSGYIKNKYYNKVFGEGSVLFSFIKQFNPRFYDRLVENKALRNVLSKLRSRNLAKPKLDSTVRDFVRLIY